MGGARYATRASGVSVCRCPRWLVTCARVHACVRVRVRARVPTCARPYVWGLTDSRPSMVPVKGGQPCRCCRAPTGDGAHRAAAVRLDPCDEHSSRAMPSDVPLDAATRGTAAGWRLETTQATTMNIFMYMVKYWQSLVANGTGRAPTHLRTGSERCEKCQTVATVQKKFGEIMPSNCGQRT
jgi:hypothetical protein